MNLITANYRVVTPAYGRDYKSAKAAKADFAAGKDFQYQNFDGCGACSVRDFAAGVTVNIRYKRLTQVTPFKVPAVKAQPAPVRVKTPAEPEKPVRAPESPVSTPPVDDGLAHRRQIEAFHAVPTSAGAVALAIADHKGHCQGKPDWPFVEYLRQAQKEATVHSDLVFALNHIRRIGHGAGDITTVAEFGEVLNQIGQVAADALKTLEK